ncbi:MAG: hypothetical protein ACFFED_04850 [Candidatus Thorarchaeota archaeon]
MMNFDEEIDKLEERFRDSEFRASVGPKQLREIESTFIAMTKYLYELRKYEKSGEEESIEAAKLRVSVQEKIEQCRTMAGLE